MFCLLSLLATVVGLALVFIFIAMYLVPNAIKVDVVPTLCTVKEIRLFGGKNLALVDTEAKNFNSVEFVQVYDVLRRNESPVAKWTHHASSDECYQVLVSYEIDNETAADGYLYAGERPPDSSHVSFWCGTDFRADNLGIKLSHSSVSMVIVKSYQVASNLRDDCFHIPCDLT